MYSSKKSSFHLLPRKLIKNVPWKSMVGNFSGTFVRFSGTIHLKRSTLQGTNPPKNGIFESMSFQTSRLVGICIHSVGGLHLNESTTNPPLPHHPSSSAPPIWPQRCLQRAASAACVRRSTSAHGVVATNTSGWGQGKAGDTVSRFWWEKDGLAAGFLMGFAVFLRGGILEIDSWGRWLKKCLSLSLSLLSLHPAPSRQDVENATMKSFLAWREAGYLDGKWWYADDAVHFLSV